LIDRLRTEIDIPLIAVEPMIKPAVKLSKTAVIAVCATPTTLSSERYSWLKDTYAKDITVLEPDCSDWAYMIETDQLDRHKIYSLIDEACKMDADVIVLGCTHYHWIENIIEETADGRAQVIQPEQPIIDEVKRVLALLA
jgi:glutamate racemase